MPLTVQEQYDAAIGALSEGDVDLLAKIFTDPAAVTIDEQRTVAQRLGLKKGFLSAAVNTATDPLVWVATLLSRKFPTSAWLRGTVPHRFIGTANEFSGLSLAFRPSEAAFRGTNIPKLVSLSMHRQATVMKTAAPMFEVMNRPNWKEEMPVVSMLLEGGNPAGATPELRAVAGKVRLHMDEMWQFLRKAHRVEGGLEEGTRATARPMLPSEAPKYLRDYLPHIPLTGEESMFEVSGKEALARLGGRRNRKMAQALEMADKRIEGDVWQVTPQDTLVSEFGRWQQWVGTVGAHVYNPHMFRRVRHGLQLAGPKGHDLFVTDLNLVLQKYAASAAKTYAINAPLSLTERSIASTLIKGPDGIERRKYPTADPIMVQLVNQGLDTAGVKMSQRQVAGTDRMIEQVVPGTGSLPTVKMLDTLVKSVRGSMGEDQILFGQMFSKVFDNIEKLRGKLSTSQLNETTAAVSAVARTRDHRHKVDALTNYFYASTLGLNTMSSVKNLLQPVITTAPAIGIGPTLAGMRELGPKVQAFAADIAAQSRALPRHHKGLPRLIEGMNRSFGKHFPELVSQRLDIDPRVYDISEESLRKFVGKDGRFIDKESFFKTLLAPFTASEMSNRAVTFYGARNALRQTVRTGELPAPKRPDGKALSAFEFDEWINFEAGNIVNATQFRPGPGSRSVVQSMLPGPLRQFTTFPLRLANFFADSTVRGAMTQAQLQEMSTLGRLVTLNGRNLGTLARTFLYGKIATNGLRDVLGVDVGGAVGLMLPFQPAPGDQPFAPLPMPPAPSALFAMMSATAMRDIERLHPMELPGGVKLPVPKTLFPAGVGLSRLFRVMNQFRPDMGGFVDENERLLYRGDSKDAILQMLGVPLDKLRRERQQMGRLHANRAVFREYGRKYRLAASTFDFAAMDQLQTKWRGAFPDMPPLAISQKDLDRFEASRRKTRVGRMIDTLPKAFRSTDAGRYDVDEDLIAPPMGAGNEAGLAALLAG